ncbi:S8 family serine peptidase [Desulfitibacter alkalitolerans]|uniref:S8 family serine peptidase n=1 Tax=Desulfitibacter alkalitolerans TaxID=264641 RepID=UPI0004888F64|nr:S8 family serine peptidase [Desulfitibacter alkalitolerans]
MQQFINSIKKLHIIIALALFILAAFPGYTPAYSDTRNHWAVQEIDLLSAKGIIGGYHDGSFRPNRSITRAEFSKIIISSLNLDEEAYNLYNVPSAFRDIPSAYWAKGYIELAYELGIINGYEDGTFRPERPIRRDELTAMLVRTLKVSSAFETTSDLGFSDENEIPGWARDPVAKALTLNLTSGYPDGSFRPAELTTRGQAAAFIVRMLEARGDALEFAGMLKGLDTVGSRMRIEIAGEDHFFNYSGSLAAYRDKKQISLSELAGGLPKNIHFIVNSRGIISYIEQVEGLRGLSLSSLTHVSTYGSPLPASPAQKSLNFSRVDYTGANPGKSLEVTINEMNVKDVLPIGAQGQGQVIAIIDTGVDPGHPDLKETTRGTAKIVDWVDFTDEMKVNTSGTIKAAGNRNYTIEGASYSIKNISSKSGEYRYGFIQERNVLRDLNFNGRFDDRFLVILSDPDTPGKYDKVYIDLAGKGEIDGQIGYRIFKESRQYFTIESADAERHFNIVVGGISPKGDWVRFGVDFNGHGTHVAGIAAGNGGIKGVAPGSQIMVLKALDTMGETNWELLKEAINYAANNGAHIINLSLGYYLDETAGNNSLTELIAKLSREQNIVFTVATGNRGPGLASLATPGNAKEAISVGAFISPAMWKQDYGFEVEHDSLWYFSSIGPRNDGLMIPDVVAPGSAVSTAPMWAVEKYSMAEGTSMAAPHVAGAVALLRDSLHRLGKSPNSQDIRRAISLGARPLDNFGPAEVGSGVIDVVEAWRKLFLVDKVKPLISQTYNKRLAFGEGLYARDFIPGEINFRINNLANEPVAVNWDSTVEWLVPELAKTRIAPTGRRTMGVSYNIPEEPGLYSGFLRGDIAATYGYDLAALVTVIRPHILEQNNQYRVHLSGELPAAQYSRHFFQVQPGAESLSVKLKVAMAGTQPLGRVRAHIIDPNGNEYFMTEYVGLGPPGSLIKDSTSASILSPEVGIWEVVVYSSPALSAYGAKKSQFNLEVNLTGTIKQIDNSRQTSSWIIGGILSDKDFGGYKAKTYQIIDRRTKRPINGVIELKGIVYEVRNGKLFIRQ